MLSTVSPRRWGVCESLAIGGFSYLLALLTLGGSVMSREGRYT